MVEAQDWGGLTSAAVAEPTRTGQTCCKPSCHPKAPECPRASSKPPAQQPMASTRQPRVPREGNRPPHYRARDRFRMTAISGDKKKKNPPCSCRGEGKRNHFHCEAGRAPVRCRGRRQGGRDGAGPARLCGSGTARGAARHIYLLNTSPS